MVGTDTLEHRKGEDLNDLFGEEIVSTFQDDLSGFSVSKFYYEFDECNFRFSKIILKKIAYRSKPTSLRNTVVYFLY